MRHFTHPLEWLKGGKFEPPLAATRVRKVGPVNWRGAVRDFRGGNGGIMARQHRARRRPSSRTPIKAIFYARFPRSRWPGDGAPKKGNVEPSLAAISVRTEGPVNWRWAIRDFRIAMLESRSVAAAPGDPCPRRPSFPDTNCGGEPPISCAISTKPLARRRGSKKGKS